MRASSWRSIRRDDAGRAERRENASVSTATSPVSGRMLLQLRPSWCQAGFVFFDHLRTTKKVKYLISGNLRLLSWHIRLAYLLFVHQEKL